MNCGVYVITSPSSNCYVGSSQNLKTRFAVHRRRLSKGMHHSYILQNACNKYGLENLKFTKLLICSIEDLLFYEQRAMDVLCPCYNVVKIAGSTLGYKHTDATRAKMSASLSGRKLSDEQIAKMRGRKLSAAQVAEMRGRKHSDETKAKMRGRVTSDEARTRMSEAQKGKKHSDATKVKLSMALKERKFSAETIAKMSAAQKGKKYSAETIANMSAAQKGKKLSEESLAKRRATVERNKCLRLPR